MHNQWSIGSDNDNLSNKCCLRDKEGGSIIIILVDTGR